MLRSDARRKAEERVFQFVRNRTDFGTDVRQPGMAWRSRADEALGEAPSPLGFRRPRRGAAETTSSTWPPHHSSRLRSSPPLPGCFSTSSCQDTLQSAIGPAITPTWAR
jgi:hypothetical protein